MGKITYMGSQVWPKPKRDRIGRYTIKSRINQFFAFLWKWTRRAIMVGAMVSLLFIAYVIGQWTTPREVTAQNVITIQAPAELAPVMQRIATAESHSHQYGTSGQVLIHVNTNGTVDLGKYQINSIWFATATKLGYDLTKEKDNEAFALWLYENKG